MSIFTFLSITHNSSWPIIWVLTLIVLIFRFFKILIYMHVHITYGFFLYFFIGDFPIMRLDSNIKLCYHLVIFCLILYILTLSFHLYTIPVSTFRKSLCSNNPKYSKALQEVFYIFSFQYLMQIFPDTPILSL